MSLGKHVSEAVCFLLSRHTMLDTTREAKQYTKAGSTLRLCDFASETGTTVAS